MVQNRVHCPPFVHRLECWTGGDLAENPVAADWIVKFGLGLPRVQEYICFLIWRFASNSTRPTPVAKVQLLCTFFSIMLVFGLHLANCKWQQWPMISLYDVNRTTQAGSGSPAQLLCAVHFHLDGGSWRNAGNNYPKVHGRVSESRFFDIESIQKLLKPSFDAMKAFRCGQLPALCLSGTARFSTAPLPKKIAVVGCGQTGPQFCNLYILRLVLVLSLLNLWSRAW